MNDAEFPGLYRRHLTDGITWTFYKHWGQGYLAGEGIEEVNGDRSGCVRYMNGLPWTSKPVVAQARLYESDKGHISAVFSYPHGIGLEDGYFWEIYDYDLCRDPERFSTEQDMERRIAEILE